MNNLTLTQSPTPDFSALDQRTDLQPSTKDKYRRAWLRAIDKGVDLYDPDSVSSYAVTLSPSSRLFLSAMMKHQTQELERAMKSGLNPHDVTPELIAQMTATFWKLENLRDAIPTHIPEGIKVHIWLSQNEVDRITALPDRTTLQGRRDYIVIALLLGAGLRREELHELTFSSLKRLPIGDGYRDVLEIHGKGAKDRAVPISPLLSQRLREWQKEVGPGRIVRRFIKGGTLGNSLSVIGIFQIIRKYGVLIEHPTLDPHDCRRSFGRLGYEATRDIMLIRDLLGHADSETTENYIGLRIKLDRTVSDYIIKPSEFFLPVSGD